MTKFNSGSTSSSCFGSTCSFNFGSGHCYSFDYVPKSHFDSCYILAFGVQVIILVLVFLPDAG